MMHPEKVEQMKAFWDKSRNNKGAVTEAEIAQQERNTAFMRDVREKLKERAKGITEAQRPKAVMLSATPFAWHYSLDYAEGYLFDHGPEPTSKGYNTPSARDRFYVENFGYRMRYGKLTQPDAAAATVTGTLERRFAEKLMKEGAMSGRALQVDQDYSRQFVLSESELGTKIDEILHHIQTNPRFSVLREFIGLGDYLARRYLLEGLKARESVARVKQHLDLGRKVVVFHDYKKGGSMNPLAVTFNPGDSKIVFNPETGKNEEINLASRLDELKKAVGHYDATKKELDGLLSPLDVYARAFPEAGIFNGSVPKGQRRAIIDKFNKSGSSTNILLVQRASGKEGISLHDRDGKHQRVFIDIGLANRPTDAIQGEGRIYRHGVRSNAIVEYLTTGTNFERWTFAQTIAQRSSTAENLAMGERARALLQSFASGYNEAEASTPSNAQGTGGKEIDRRIDEGNSYKTAIALFYTNQKKTSGNKSAEGTDYFATPEPVGFKMVEWADIQPGEKVLEPSGGHGAIARFFPDSTNRHAVEPSNELAGRLALNATDTTIHNMRFEDYHIGNKFNAVVMNPPFGTAGKTAMEHLTKALGHLKEGGRTVALIPVGSSMESRFDKWFYGDDAKDYHLRAEIKLPSSTFSRAGTSVNTRVLVIDKVTPAKDGTVPDMDTKRADLSGVSDINELFKELEFVSVPPRPEVAQGAEPESPEAVQNPAAALMNNGRAGMLPKSPTSTIPTPERDSTWSPAEFNHTKTGSPIFVAKIMRNLSREDYVAAAAQAKSLGGHYSNYKGSGAIPGFHFDSAESRDEFIGGGGSTLRSSPSRPEESPDLEESLKSPDAAEKLADVKVGTMSALGAYRTLTAKREAGKVLSPKEENQLSDAEAALRDRLDGDKHSPERLDRKPDFSIGRPHEIFNDLLKASPSSHEYTDEPTSNPRIQEALNSVRSKLFGGTAPRTVRSHTFADDTRAFEKNTGIKVQLFRIPGADDYRRHAAFVHPDHPGVIFVNAASKIPTKSLLAHEWLHNASHDPKAAIMLDEFAAAVKPLYDKEKFDRYGEDLAGDYTEEQIPSEILGDIFSDALQETPLYGTDQLVSDWPKVKKLASDLFEQSNPLRPEGLKEASDDELLSSQRDSILRSSPSRPESDLPEDNHPAWSNLPPEMREVFRDYAGGKPVPDIAKDSGLSEKAVSNIIGVVQKRFAKDGVPDPTAPIGGTTPASGNGGSGKPPVPPKSATGDAPKPDDRKSQITGAAMRGMKTLSNILRGTSKSKAVRDLESLGVLDPATQHVGARTYATLLVKHFLHQIFEGKVKDAEFVQKVGETVMKDNILGGYDGLRNRLLALQEIPEGERMAEQNRDINELSNLKSDTKKNYQ